MRWPSLVVVAGIGACTPRAVTPPSRTFVMDSPSAPWVGGSDLQLDAAGIGEVWGPELLGGNARLRHTVEPGVAVEVDTGVLRVTNPGTGGDRNGYTGRLGVLLHSQDHRLAFGGGLSPAAGSWGSADVHGAISGAHRYVRPVLGGGLAYSGPLGHQTFAVRDVDDSSDTMLRLPRNVIGEFHLGLELGPPDKALVLGASLLHFWLRDDSRVSAPASSHQSEDFVALGFGFRFALD